MIRSFERVYEQELLLLTQLRVTLLQAGELKDVDQKPLLSSQLRYRAVFLVVVEVVLPSSMGLLMAKMLLLPSIGTPFRVELIAALELVAALRQQLT